MEIAPPLSEKPTGKAMLEMGLGDSVATADIAKPFASNLTLPFYVRICLQSSSLLQPCPAVTE